MVLNGCGGGGGMTTLELLENAQQNLKTLSKVIPEVKDNGFFLVAMEQIFNAIMSELTGNTG
jgi:glycosyltransferase A (GT-A) superfamily protein (DUF2064 family)